MSEQGGGGDTLPGEDLNSTALDDVRHWIGVYEELTGTLAALIGQEEGPGADRPTMEQVREQHRQAEGRLRFWQRRLAQVQHGP
ncbi:MAG: hypothetical protein J2P45_17140 [Candidatus Dormibacteraeota bacterium]|nr:hypothetical protein [Candidatus Dormibacteraeota bacterium]